MHRYFPHTDSDIAEMLKAVGLQKLDDLYAEVPEELKLSGELKLPESKSEAEIRKIFEELAAHNKPLTCFAGAGAYDHYTPSLIPYIASRSEFSTSYTPYQAEISQGTLMYIFEYQTLMAELTGMEVSNASMYDGSTATAEAMMMACAASKKRNKVLMSATLNPRVKDVVKTYAHFHGVDLEEVDAASNGLINREAISSKLSADDVAGLIVSQPNFFGLVEDFSGLADECHAHKTLLIINSPASTLGALKSPGEWGADIACGDAQSLGLPLNYGGPYIGYLCTSNSLIRKMPGRIVGQTVDAEGKRTFVLTMQAREQHIRREKATSNICTSQGMMCLYVAAYLSLMGPKGLQEVNDNSFKAAHYLCKKLLQTGRFKLVFDAPFFNEFCLEYSGDVDGLIKKCAQEGVLAGVKIDDRKILIAATEKRTKEEMDHFVELTK